MIMYQSISGNLNYHDWEIIAGTFRRRAELSGLSDISERQRAIKMEILSTPTSVEKQTLPSLVPPGSPRLILPVGFSLSEQMKTQIKLALAGFFSVKKTG